MHLVRCTPHRWGFRSGWHFLTDLWVSWPLGEASGKVGHFCQIFWSGCLWSMYPPDIDIWCPGVRCTPLSSEASGQVDIFVRSLDQADLWSDVPLSSEASGQFWHFFFRSLGQADLQSDVPPAVRLQVRLTFLPDLQFRLTLIRYTPSVRFQV